tara:strand:- start:219 stop:428 length:210 start_codon:yes stop_codon:yes gene_type:complete
MFHKKDTAGNPRSGFSYPTRRRHVSYNKYETYIQDLEEQLRQKYHCGYSTLHKKLVLEKGNSLMNIGMI